MDKTKLAEFHNNTLLMPGLEVNIIEFATGKYFKSNEGEKGHDGRVRVVLKGLRGSLTIFNLLGSVEYYALQTYITLADKDLRW